MNCGQDTSGLAKGQRIGQAVGLSPCAIADVKKFTSRQEDRPVLKILVAEDFPTDARAHTQAKKS